MKRVANFAADAAFSALMRLCDVFVRLFFGWGRDEWSIEPKPVAVKGEHKVA